MALADALRTFMYVSLWGKPVISVARGLSGNATANIDAAYLELGLTVYNEEL